jgi:hypothetical protein
MKDASRLNARRIGRTRTALLLAGAVAVGALFVGLSGMVFGAGTASARTNIFIPYWNTAMSHNVPHWDDGCECYSGTDSVFDGFDRSYMLFPPDNVLDLSPPMPLGPKGARPIAVTFETFGSTHIKSFNEFQMNSAGTSGKLIKTVTAPAGANGATLSTSSSTGTASQVVTWSKNGVTVGTPVSVDISYYVDFAAQQKIVCSNGLLSPPIAVQPTLMNSDGTTLAGRTILEPCKYRVAKKIKYTK